MLEYQVDRSLQDAFCNLLEEMGFDSYGHQTIKNPDWIDAETFGLTNEVFVIRPYCWDCVCQDIDVTTEEIEKCKCSLPNFEHIPTGFKLSWYKYALRGAYSNVPLTHKMIAEWLIQNYNG